ncbi:MAG: site-specific integrase [Bdellovibrionales bacterium]|nr:site-specific integrase [Bdellovibrionales bacterium]
MIKLYFKDNKKFFEVFVKSKDLNGKQTAKRRRGITSERMAKEIEFKFKKELQMITDPQSKWTWTDWHTECIRRMTYSRRKSTIESYDCQVKKWIPQEWNKRPLVSFQQSDIHELIFERIGNNLKPGALKCYLKMIKRLFEMAVQEGILSKNPATGLSVVVPKSVQKVLTAEEAEILLKAAKETHHSFYPVWAFALMTGMRSGEMYALKWSDINFDTDVIHVNKQWTSKEGFGPTKTRENRVVPISPDLRVFLKELKLKTGDSEFVLPRLKRWTKGLQARVLKEFCKGLNITDIKFHDLRATFITNMLAQGVPLVTVMAIVGHARMSTTDVYLRLAGVNVRGATNKLGYELPKFDLAQVYELKRGVNE